MNSSKYPILFVCILLHYSTMAQIPLNGLDLDDHVLTWYDQNAGLENSGLIAGSYFQVNRLTNGDHQFYITDHWTACRIHYRGQEYHEVELIYDIDHDVVLMRHPTKLMYHSQPIKLIQNQIAWFEFEGKMFRFHQDQILSLNPGFLEELYQGDSIHLMAKRIKSVTVNKEINYSREDVFVLEYSNHYYRIRSKASVLRLLKEKKKEINQYVRQNQLRIKPDYEEDIINLMGYCERLLTIQKGEEI